MMTEETTPMQCDPKFAISRFDVLQSNISSNLVLSQPRKYLEPLRQGIFTENESDCNMEISPDQSPNGYKKLVGSKCEESGGTIICSDDKMSISQEDEENGDEKSECNMEISPEQPTLRDEGGEEKKSPVENKPEHSVQGNEANVEARDAGLLKAIGLSEINYINHGTVVAQKDLLNNFVGKHLQTVPKDILKRVNHMRTCPFVFKRHVVDCRDSDCTTKTLTAYMNVASRGENAGWFPKEDRKNWVLLNFYHSCNCSLQKIGRGEQESIKNLIPKISLDFKEQSNIEMLLRIGKGGFGEVYHVLSSTSDRRAYVDYAMKLPKEKDCSTWTKLLHEVSRNGVAKFFEKIMYSEHICAPYTNKALAPMCIATMSVFDFVNFTKRKRLEPDVAMRILRDATMGLSALHSENLVHRDVKCENMLMYWHPNGEFSLVKICDLDFVCYAGTRADKLCGTLGYLDPKIIRKEIREYKASCDMFALGVCIYYMVIGTIYERTNGGKRQPKPVESMRHSMSKRFENDPSHSHNALGNLTGLCFQENPRNRISSHKMKEVLANLKGIWGLAADKMRRPPLHLPTPKDNDFSVAKNAEAYIMETLQFLITNEGSMRDHLEKKSKITELFDVEE